MAFPTKKLNDRVTRGSALEPEAQRNGRFRMNKILSETAFLEKL
jgi:hypothetical protein